MIANVISVCIGGMIGTGLRYAIKVNMNSTAFTLPTFVSNAAGCLLLGIIVAIGEQSNMSDVLRLGLIVGCCGALTTFSTIITTL
jgi:Integral membrane protein possibly involved in chromosome condensation